MKQFPGTIVSSQIEYEHMQIFYHLEIENQQQELIEINISAKSGKIIGFEYKE
ncbi:MAG: PepSY domain-containing protein [Thomasclavelia ramosa]